MSTVASTTRSSLAVAPEDIQVGDYLGVLQSSCQFPPFLWSDEFRTGGLDECVRVTYLPHNGGVPLKVKSISLPFILVRTPKGRADTLDVRQCRLAKLDRSYAEAAWEALKKRRRRKSR